MWKFIRENLVWKFIRENFVWKFIREFLVWKFIREFFVWKFIRGNHENDHNLLTKNDPIYQLVMINVYNFSVFIHVWSTVIVSHTKKYDVFFVILLHCGVLLGNGKMRNFEKSGFNDIQFSISWYHCDRHALRSILIPDLQASSQGKCLN